MTNTMILSPPFYASSPTLPECQHLWGDVLETSLSPARDNPGPNMGAICNRDIFLPLLGFESGSFGMTAQRSTDRAKGLNH